MDVRQGNRKILRRKTKRQKQLTLKQKAKMKEITPEEQFKNTLNKLAEQLKEIESTDIDEKTVEILKSVKDKTQKLIEETKQDDTEKTFAEAIEHFEESHPELTSTLQSIMNMLSGIGI